MTTIGLDVETTSIPIHHPWMKGALLVAVGIATEDGNTHTWVFNHDELRSSDTDQRHKINEIQAMISEADRIVGHNLKFDLNWLRYTGIEFDHCKLWCTQVTEYLLRCQRIGNMTLHDLSVQYLNVDKKDRVETFWDAGYETTEIPLNILIPYLEQDCINALAIYQRQAKRVQEENMSALVALKNEEVRTLSAIECNGMKWDTEVATKHTVAMREEIEHLNDELIHLFGWDVNLDSNDELSVALYGGDLKRDGLEWVTRELKYETKYYQRKCVVTEPLAGVGFKPPEDDNTKREGYYSTSKQTIKRLTANTSQLRKIKKLLLERSKVNKALATLAGKDEQQGKGLVNKVQEDGCLHPQYTQTVTVTGRLSSRDPNGQNLPRKGTSPIKQAIIPRHDWIVNADLAQIEWRAAAFLSQDPVMIREILGNIDCHADNAINFFGVKPEDKNFDEIRTIAKIMTFRLLYGGSAYGFYMDQQMPNYSQNRWKEIVSAFRAKYKVLVAWQEENLRKVSLSKGKLINPTGRQFDIELTPKGYNRRQVCNYPVQSFATADITPLAMTIIHKKMREAGAKSLLIGQVHDSIIFDAVDDEVGRIAKLCISVFESLPKYIEQLWGFKFNVPLTGDIEYGKSYGALKKYKLGG